MHNKRVEDMTEREFELELQRRSHLFAMIEQGYRSLDTIKKFYVLLNLAAPSGFAFVFNYDLNNPFLKNHVFWTLSTFMVFVNLLWLYDYNTTMKRIAKIFFGFYDMQEEEKTLGNNAILDYISKDIRTKKTGFNWMVPSIFVCWYLLLSICIFIHAFF